MVSKRLKWILWGGFVVLLFLSGVGVSFAFAIRKVLPMAINDSSLNFAQLAEDDRWAVYHEAQWWLLPMALVILVLAVLWAALAGFSIWKLSRKSGHEIL